jgi:UbiD family decarboxylase
VAYASLREYLARLEEEGELVHVKREVNLVHEVGAVCYKAMRSKSPALMFDRLQGSDVPLAVNLFSSRKRFGLAIDADPDRLPEVWLERTARPIAPVTVSDGPVKQNVHLGDDVDLYQIPVPTWNELDGGPYITFAASISQDPVDGSYNAGIYRHQVFNRNTLGILAAPYTHIMQQRAKQPNGPFPVAIVIGADPTLVLVGAAPFPMGIDELAMAGGLREQALELVSCETIPLLAPASAEYILEGEIWPDDKMLEGPFGEFAGYYGSQLERQVVRIKAITHRDDPIHHATYTGLPPHESALITSIPREAEIMRSVSLAGLRQVHVTESGCGAFNVIVQISKLYEGYGKLIGMSILGSPVGRYVKNLIVVEEDVDPFDHTQVEWALATRVQPHRDVDIVNDVTGVILDPSLSEAETLGATVRGSKMIIDATRYNAKSYPALALPNVESMHQVEANWDDYGIPFDSGRRSGALTATRD